MKWVLCLVIIKLGTVILHSHNSLPDTWQILSERTKIMKKKKMGYLPHILSYDSDIRKQIFWSANIFQFESLFPPKNVELIGDSILCDMKFLQSH